MLRLHRSCSKSFRLRNTKSCRLSGRRESRKRWRKNALGTEPRPNRSLCRTRQVRGSGDSLLDSVGKAASYDVFAVAGGCDRPIWQTALSRTSIIVPSQRSLNPPGNAEMERLTGCGWCDAFLYKMIEFRDVDWFDEMMLESNLAAFSDIFFHTKTR